MTTATHSLLRVYITKICKEKADERLGSDGKNYLISYAAEQWQLGNVFPEKCGASYLEMPPRARDPDSVIWIAELDGRIDRLVLLDIGPRHLGKRDGFAQYVADICGRFVGGVIESMVR